MDSKQFLEQVLSHIRSKEAKGYVNAELSQHMQHEKVAWMKKGYSKLEAEEKAVLEMGNPSTLGKSFNQLHKPKIDWLLVSLFIGMMIISFLPILALNGPQYDIQLYIENKIFHIIAGIIVVIGIMLVDYSKFTRWGYAFYAAGALFVTFLYLFHNQQINGEPMFSIGPITLQVWLAIPLFCIAWAALFSKENFPLWQAIVLVMFSFVLLSYIPNFSVLFIYSVMTFVLFLQSKFSRNQKGTIIVLVIGAIVGFISFVVISYKKGVIADYQLVRLFGFWNPEAYATSSGSINILLADILREAKWFGSGTAFVIPEAHTDLVFGHIIQSFGLALAFVIFIILCLTLVRLALILTMIKNPFGKLLISGCIAIFSTQLLYEVGMTIGLVPISSMPLPFISYGLMPTVLNAFLIGVALNVYRRKHFVQVSSIANL